MGRQRAYCVCIALSGATSFKPNQVSVTVSAGVVARDASFPDAESVLQAAESRPYIARKSGRNRVAFSANGSGKKRFAALEVQLLYEAR